MLASILTLMAIVLFAAGVRSLFALQQLGAPTDAERADPFFNFVGLLFSTATRTDEFRVVQRRTIWLFCGSMLLLYLARMSLIQADAV